MVPFPMTERTLTMFQGQAISQMATDTAIVTIEDEQETATKLSNGASFTDLE